ncbi:PhzF family phenazine biosynthesis protein [Rhizobiaceae bacterium BDR2-2]|uniref:PhzF family phenazine biosynthesis protein n=1 Tax=Ectorhizobium quercum TaxID=2965071 RepID=A0AAE3N3W5_9HYPH|nr:PhzF family phenazine biosynthesis protein [Ectorhizobium quercum]MCX8999761.1 PhzF family phenazine biosynthesis protein [Ectorhizobium quercum]
MAREYAIYDVFTGTKLAGNPLAVVFDAAGLSGEAMQAIAAEMNLSETVFVLPPDNPTHAHRLRIFTPATEVPFAGHPTVGSAVALSERRHGTPDGGLDLVIMLEEKIGPVRAAVKLQPGRPTFAEFDLPKLSEQLPLEPDADGLAAMLGLAPRDIGFENHKPSLWSAGVPFLIVPLRDVAAVGRIVFDRQIWARVSPADSLRRAPVYAYCRGGIHHEASFHARMFSPSMGIAEDPATGAAVAALSGALHRFDALPDGLNRLMIEQGVEMGRPSHIHLHIEVFGGAVSRARIGGEAVPVASGVLHV